MPDEDLLLACEDCGDDGSQSNGSQSNGIAADSLRLLLVSVLLQGTLIWISLRGIIDNDHLWWPVLYASIALTVSVGVVFALHLIGLFAKGNKAWGEGLPEFTRLIAPGVFLFVCNAVPNASDTFSSYKYSLFFDRPCHLATINLVSSGASILGCLIYSRLCNKKKIRLVLGFTTVLGVLSGLLWLPLLSLNDGNDAALTRVFDDLDLDAYQYTLVATAVTGLISTFAILPATVLATESTTSTHKTVSYAVYLSIIDSGSSASGWITAPIVTSLGIEYGDWEPGLTKLIWIGAGSQLAVLVLLPLIRNWQSSTRVSKG